MSDWNPTQYLAFADERTRAARDLLAQVPLMRARRVYDLGCGPGNSTALLVERFPGASVTGIDNSPAMIAAARVACPGADFMLADLSHWTPPEGADLLFSNATFQWVPDHAAVLERLAARLAPGAALAVQMPDNLSEPSHRLMAETALNGPWRAALADARIARDALASAADYYHRLKPHFARLDIWHTIYNHPLAGADGIIRWFSSTGLRPYLAALDQQQGQAFIDDYRARIARAYPAGADGTVLLRFPRLFLVGTR